MGGPSSAATTAADASGTNACGTNSGTNHGTAGGADLLVCDMNSHAAQTLRLLRQLLWLLRPGGLLLFTLKFFGSGR